MAMARQSQLYHGHLSRFPWESSYVCQCFYSFRNVVRDPEFLIHISSEKPRTKAFLAFLHAFPVFIADITTLNYRHHGRGS